MIDIPNLWQCGHPVLPPPHSNMFSILGRWCAGPAAGSLWCASWGTKCAQWTLVAVWILCWHPLFAWNRWWETDWRCLFAFHSALAWLSFASSFLTDTSRPKPEQTSCLKIPSYYQQVLIIYASSMLKCGENYKEKEKKGKKKKRNK